MDRARRTRAVTNDLGRFLPDGTWSISAASIESENRRSASGFFGNKGAARN
jgi:hypothetical protein